MKKLIALLLALTLVVAFAGCEKKEAGLPPVDALTAITTLTTAYNEAYAGTDYQLPLSGGGYENTDWEKPAAVLLTDTGYLNGTLLVPETELTNISAAAAAQHSMMINNFCAGAYNLVDGADYGAFATALREAVQGNRWMCGFPEMLLIANVGDCIVAVYGNSALVEKFHDILNDTYAGATILYNEPIQG